jgi:hypothetical protein
VASRVRRSAVAVGLIYSLWGHWRTFTHGERRPAAVLVFTLDVRFRILWCRAVDKDSHRVPVSPVNSPGPRRQHSSFAAAPRPERAPGQPLQGWVDTKSL